MPKTEITAKFVRVPVENGRIRVAAAFDDYFEVDKMAVLELGMQRGNLQKEYFPASKSEKLISDVNQWNENCRKAGIPIIHIGYQFRACGVDLRKAQNLRITPLSGKRPFPNPDMKEGSELCEFATEVKREDLCLLSAKRHNAFEGTDLEFLLKVTGRKIIILVGVGLDCLGMGTGFCGMCKDYKTLIVEDRFLPYFEDLGEVCARACTMFIGLVVRADELLEEIRVEKG